MTRPRVYKTEAIVLKRISLGEADNIVTLYTPHMGKIRAVAKGVRRPRSKLGGHLEPLTQSSLLIAQGQNLDIITQGQTIEGFLRLRTSLWHACCAIYVAELVDQFTPDHVEDYPFYRLLHTSLLWLCEARNCELALRYFELHLLSHLGYQPELYECLNCRSSLEPKRNLFSVRDGGVLCPDCSQTGPLAQPISVDAIKAMRYLLTSDRASAGRLRMNSELSRELEQLLRGYMRHLLEREVRSAAFLDQLRIQGG
jgi:DNA repair protein RecO (recombination protein O)